MDEHLARFINELPNESHLRIETDFGDGFVRLCSEEAQKRQAAQDIRCVEDALLELLRNSRDAQAKSVYVAMSRSEGLRTLSVIDDGCGIPTHMHERIFEARVTGKLDAFHADSWGVHGRGMALYSIRVNAQEASVVKSIPGIGTAMRAVFDTHVLPEKADQSTFPEFALNEDFHVGVTGPKNLLRIATEFALENRGSMQVFIGSESEIAASLYQRHADEPRGFQALCQQGSEDGIIDSLSGSADPAEFCSRAEELGIKLSERTSRRIMDGSIEPLQSLENIIRGIVNRKFAAAQTKEATQRKRHAAPTAKLSKEDVCAMQTAVEKAIAPTLKRYYAQPSGRPRVRWNGDELQISIKFSSTDN